MQVDGYELELEKINKTIIEQSPKTVVLQLPDGMKQHATQIVKEIEKVTNVKPDIWLGSNYGACDIPTQLESRYDLLIHFGHSPWVFAKDIKPTYKVVD